MSARYGRLALRHPIGSGNATAFSSSNAPRTGFFKTNLFELRRLLRPGRGISRSAGTSGRPLLQDAEINIGIV
jgi:hypothetical protein